MHLWADAYGFNPAMPTIFQPWIGKKSTATLPVRVIVICRDSSNNGEYHE